MVLTFMPTMIAVWWEMQTEGNMFGVKSCEVLVK